jgi:plastocyanin
MDPHPHLIPGVRPLFATLLAAALVLGVAACGDDDSTSGDSGTTAADDATTTDDAYGTTGGDDGGEATEGTIVAKDFTLTDLTVGPGDAIMLKNEGDTAHTATADDGEFDLGQVAPGETSDPGSAPDEPGSYAFHCEIHPNMTATLTVEG